MITITKWCCICVKIGVLDLVNGFILNFYSLTTHENSDFLVLLSFYVVLLVLLSMHFL